MLLYNTLQILVVPIQISENQKTLSISSNSLKSVAYSFHQALFTNFFHFHLSLQVNYMRFTIGIFMP